MVQGFSLFILGIIATFSLAATNITTGWLRHSLVPAQGFLGMLFCLWGIYSLISHSLSGTDQWQHKNAFLVSMLLINLMHIVIGYLMGFNLILKYVYSGNDEIKRKGTQRLLKRAPQVGKAGIAGIILGLAAMLYFSF